MSFSNLVIFQMSINLIATVVKFIKLIISMAKFVELLGHFKTDYCGFGTIIKLTDFAQQPNSQF